LSVNILLIHAGEGLEEALSKVLTQEGIEYGIHGRIGINQSSQKQKYEYLQPG